MKKQLIKEPLEQLIIRPYKPKDAEAIVSWIKDERALRKWSSDRYGAYPITAEDIIFEILGERWKCVELDGGKQGMNYLENHYANYDEEGRFRLSYQQTGA